LEWVHIEEYKVNWRWDDCLWDRKYHLGIKKATRLTITIEQSFKKSATASMRFAILKQILTKLSLTTTTFIFLELQRCTRWKIVTNNWTRVGHKSCNSHAFSGMAELEGTGGAIAPQIFPYSIKCVSHQLLKTLKFF